MEAMLAPADLLEGTQTDLDCRYHLFNGCVADLIRHYHIIELQFKLRHAGTQPFCSALLKEVFGCLSLIFDQDAEDAILATPQGPVFQVKTLPYGVVSHMLAQLLTLSAPPKKNLQALMVAICLA